MIDYISLGRKTSKPAAGGLAAKFGQMVNFAQRYFHLRQKRAELKPLLHTDNTVLLDMGLTRADVAWALSLPLDIDAAQQLERVRKNRRDASMANI